MELTKLSGSTYYIQSPTNIGIYTFRNKECLIIDTGIGSSHAKKIDRVLDEKGLRPKYIINTHAHTDHCGGNSYFKEAYPGVQIYSSENSKFFIENNEFGAAILGGGKPLKKLMDKKKECPVDFILDMGVNKIGDTKVEIIPLEGHTVGHLAILTSDKICFLGDSIFSKAILEKYSFPYLYDIGESIASLNKIKEIDGEIFVLSHSTRVYSKEEILDLVDFNLDNLNMYLDQFRDILSQPMTIEDLVENISVLNDLELNFKQYHLNKSTTAGFVAYLHDNGELAHTIDNGKLYYYIEK